MGMQFGGGSKQSVRRKVKPNLLNAKNDPLAGVEATGDLAVDSLAELDAVERAYAEEYRERNKRENDRFKQATDSEFWFAACFRTREDKEKFLAEFKLTGLGDKYLDGGKMAARLRKNEGR